jgi:23S rRNA (adenine2503-C2)-methyltransferase
MRADQVWRWIYHYGVTEFSAMTNRRQGAAVGDLDRAYTLARPAVTARQISVDGTRKWLIRLNGGQEVECVYIPDVGSGRGAARFQPGRLHADVQLLLIRARGNWSET